MNVHRDEYLVHDLLLDYAKANIGEALAKDAAVRQAQHLSKLEVLDKYASRGEHADGGFYSLVGLWGSVLKLDELLVPTGFYLETLGTVTQTEGWMHAAHVLRLMVSTLAGVVKEQLPLKPRWGACLAAMGSASQAINKICTDTPTLARTSFPACSHAQSLEWPVHFRKN